MKIIFSTGGTGGHIYPALALANYMKNNIKDVDITFTGSSKHMEKDIVTSAGFHFEGYHLKSGSRSLFHKFMQYVQLGFALILMYFRFLFNRPDVVIGFGAYITAPTLLAAKFLNIPIILHEQNSSLGKTNEMFFKAAKLVVVCYPNLLEQLNNEKVVLLGNPRASEVSGLRFDEKVIESFGLDPKLKTILVVMGSLGSESVNHAMSELIPALNKKPYQLIMVTGKKHYDAFKLLDEPDNVVIVPYVDQAAILASSDLVIARGGATTAAEICALGIPSIIIPSPYVSNNHQYVNAVELEKVDAARIIKEENLSADALIELIDDLMNDEEQLKAMSNSALSLAKAQASEDITKAILEKISND